MPQNPPHPKPPPPRGLPPASSPASELSSTAARPVRARRNGTAVASCQLPVASQPLPLATGYWRLVPAMLFGKCGELLAGLLDFCRWPCSSRPSRRWRCLVLPCRKPCTACAGRCPHGRRSLSCTAIMRWRSRSRPSPNHRKLNPPKPRFRPPMTMTAAVAIAAAALPPPNGRSLHLVCSHS